MSEPKITVNFDVTNFLTDIEMVAAGHDRWKLRITASDRGVTHQLDITIDEDQVAMIADVAANVFGLTLN